MCSGSDNEPFFCLVDLVDLRAQTSSRSDFCSVIPLEKSNLAGTSSLDHDLFYSKLDLYIEFMTRKQKERSEDVENISGRYPSLLLVSYSASITNTYLNYPPLFL